MNLSVKMALKRRQSQFIIFPTLAYLIVTFACCSPRYISKYPGNFNPGTSRYHNSFVGYSLKIDSNWVIYTDPEYSTPEFKSNFYHSKLPPLFYGRTNNQRAYMRCLVDTTDLSLTQYVKVVADQDCKNYTTLDANYLSLGKYHCATYQYLITFGNFNYRFKEYLFLNNKRILRLGFWTLNALFDDYKASFDRIASTSSFLDSSLKQVTWSSLESPIDENAKSEPIPLTCGSKRAPAEDVYYDSICSSYSKNCLWKISSPKNTVSVFGSISQIKPELFPLDTAIENAFNRSKYLVVSINILAESNKKRIASASKQVALLGGGKTLKDEIPLELYARVDSFAIKYHVPMKQLSKFQPWFVATFFQLTSLQIIGINPEKTLENYFLEKNNNQKTVLEYDSIGAQITLVQSTLNNASYLSYVLNTMDDFESRCMSISRAWKCGNAKYIEKINETDFSADLYDTKTKFLIEPNKRISSKILEYLKDDKDYFVVVSMDNLVGEKNVLSQVAEKGYSILQQ